MSAIDVIRFMGADVAWADGALEVMGLDVLPADVAEHVIALAREHKEELARELSGASAPGPGHDDMGLGWVTCPTDDTAPDFGARWSAFDLADLARLYGIRIAHAGERVIAVYQPTLEPELVAYAGSLLAEARPYLTANLDKLPVLAPSEAVEIIKDVMHQHPGLKFCRGEGGSRWPLYPMGWTAGQRATVQGLWFAAGPALDHDDFEGIGAG